MARTRPTVDKRIVMLFLKSIAAGTGFYNPCTKKFDPTMESTPLYQSNLEVVRAALKEGWTASELEAWICDRYKAGERTALLSIILPKKSTAQQLGEDENLLEPEVNYQHSALYDREPPTFDVTDECCMLVHPGMVHRKRTFTLSDLVDYYLNMLELPASASRRNTTTGALRWLLKDARVDVVLTTIDLAVDVAPPAIKLGDWLEEARSIVHEKEGRLTE